MRSRTLSWHAASPLNGTRCPGRRRMFTMSCTSRSGSGTNSSSKPSAPSPCHLTPLPQYRQHPCSPPLRLSRSKSQAICSLTVLQQQFNWHVNCHSTHSTLFIKFSTSRFIPVLTSNSRTFKELPVQNSRKLKRKLIKLGTPKHTRMSVNSLCRKWY